MSMTVHRNCNKTYKSKALIFIVYGGCNNICSKYKEVLKLGNTSWQVKAKYNKKVYKTISAQLDRELVTRWEEKLQKDGIGKSEFIRQAIKNYLGE